MKWRSLDEWYRVERELKERLDALTQRPFPAMPEIGGEHWLTRQVTLALAPAFLLAPLVTWLLYPWLPQREAWMYEAAGVMLLAAAYVAHADYKKAQRGARELSEFPPDAGEVSRAVSAGQSPAERKLP